MSTELQQKQAVTRLQALWRGYQVRKRHAKPQTDKPGQFKTLIKGNDPKIQISTKFDSFYVFVGTSGIKSLQLIKELTPGSSSDSREYRYIPKLYVVDYSADVVKFWIILKECALGANNIELFAQRVRAHKHELEDCSKFISDSPDNVLISVMCELANIDPVTFRPLKDSENSYSFFRKVLEKATILCHDWKDLAAFKFIREHTAKEIPIIVYVSNIIEYINLCRLQLSSDDIKLQVNKVLDSILFLKPLLSIHTRTLLQSNGNCCYLRPEEALVLKGCDRAAHLQELYHPRFRTMTPPLLKCITTQIKQKTKMLYYMRTGRYDSSFRISDYRIDCESLSVEQTCDPKFAAQFLFLQPPRLKAPG